MFVSIILASLALVMVAKPWRFADLADREYSALAGAILLSALLALLCS